MFAQTDISLNNCTSNCVVSSNVSYAFDGMRYCYVYGDSVVNDVMYKRLLVSYADLDPSWLIYYDKPDTIMLYRTENKKIMRYDSEKGFDVVVYDFGLEEGDVFSYEDGNTLRVVKKSPAKELSKFNSLPDGYMALFLSDGDDGEIKDVWIENVGSIHYGLLTPSDLGNLAPTDLIYSHSNSGAVYFDTSTKRQQLRHIPFHCEDLDWETLSELMENKAVENLNDLQYIDYAFSGDTLVIEGMAFFYDKTNIMEISCKDNVISVMLIPVFTLGSIIDPKTFHFFEIHIPGFEAGDYTIKTIPYYLPTTSDKTLHCEGKTVTKITEFSSTKCFNGTSYDLSGRSLKAEPRQGIYIKDGRKYVK